MGDIRKSAGTATEAGLERLLEEAGSAYDPAGLDALIAGLAAAPAGGDPEAWLALVAPHPAPELRRRLLDLEAVRRQAAETAAAPPPGAALHRIAGLRAELVRRHVHGFLVPRADEHQGEYVPARAQRLAWLTGFTGSAGLAIVLPKAASIFVDGRYTLQAEAEVDGTLYERRHISDAPATDWIAATLQAGETLAYDPRLHTPGEIDRYRAAAERAGGKLAPLADNPLDAVWTDQPPPPLAPVAAHPLAFAGERAAEKCRRIAGDLDRAGTDAVVLTAPDSIAWRIRR
jgi:Xaa-Pro aminopeptidase